MTPTRPRGLRASCLLLALLLVARAAHAAHAVADDDGDGTSSAPQDSQFLQPVGPNPPGAPPELSGGPAHPETTTAQSEGRDQDKERTTSEVQDGLDEVVGEPFGSYVDDQPSTLLPDVTNHNNDQHGLITVTDPLVHSADIGVDSSSVVSVTTDAGNIEDVNETHLQGNLNKEGGLELGIYENDSISTQEETASKDSRKEIEGSGTLEGHENTDYEFFLGDAPSYNEPESSIERFGHSELGEEFRKIMSSFGTNWLLGNESDTIEEISDGKNQDDKVHSTTELTIDSSTIIQNEEANSDVMEVTISPHGSGIENISPPINLADNGKSAPENHHKFDDEGFMNDDTGAGTDPHSSSTEDQNVFEDIDPSNRDSEIAQNISVNIPDDDLELSDDVPEGVWVGAGDFSERDNYLFGSQDENNCSQGNSGDADSRVHCNESAINENATNSEQRHFEDATVPKETQGNAINELEPKLPKNIGDDIGIRPEELKNGTGESEIEPEGTSAPSTPASSGSGRHGPSSGLSEADDVIGRRPNELNNSTGESGTRSEATSSPSTPPSPNRGRVEAPPGVAEAVAAAEEAELAAAGDGVLSDAAGFAGAAAAAAAQDDDASGSSPHGASLAFVFDSTGSMHDDLQQVMAGTQAIMKTMLADEHKPIHNYVLVPFHDPRIGPLTVTTNHTQFNNSLKAITVHAGGDCPEMALGGVRLALEASLPRSFVYVFTDASAKDTDLLPDVLALVQRKKSQVVFVLTGDCGDRNNLRYKVYEKIADTSSGQVFHLNKTEVEEVLEFVRLSLQSRRVNLLSVTRAGGSREEHSLLVDGSLDEFTVAVAGENAQVGVEDPRGRPVAQPRLQPVLSLKDVKVVKIEKPDPGRWKVRTASDSTHSVRSTGTSRMDIRFGFSVSPVANLHQTFHRPLKGTPNNILIQATEHKDLHNLTTLRLVNLNGSTINEILLTPLDPNDLKGAYTGTPFVPPTDIFFIEVTGLGSDGYPMKRMAPTAISAQKPDVPIVTMKPRLSIPVGKSGTITCYIESLVPFSVMWLKDGALVQEKKTHKQTTDVYLEIANMTEKLEGSYTCYAMNQEGSTSKQIKLRMTGPPPSITMKERIVTQPGENVDILCEVESVLNYTTTWSRYSGKKRDFKKGKPWPLHSDDHMVIDSNTLRINMVKPEDEGWYSCLVQSRGGKKEGNTYLQVRDPVHVVLYPPRLLFQQGEEISISCRASGTPIPSLIWRKDGSILEDGNEDGRISITSELGEADILIKDTDQSDEGLYECLADNGIDSDHQESAVEYVEQPTVTARHSRQLVALGESVDLQCEKTGSPSPVLKWLKDNEEISPGGNKVILDDILKIFNVKDEDAGIYTCEVINTAGKNEDTTELEVGSFPYIIKSPTDTTVEINQNISLPCVATGHPSPSISWQRKYQEPLPPERYLISVTGTLHIFDAQVEDAGIYICRVENKLGGIEKAAKLKITGIEKPVIDRNDDNKRMSENALGSNLELTCRILMGKPIPLRIWYKDGIEIDEQTMKEEGFILNGNGSLIVPYVTHKHEGTYECVAKNAGGSVSKETVVHVVEAPYFGNRATPEHQAIVGDDVLLQCDVQGDPKPLVTWEKDGLLLVPSLRIKIEDDDSLTIRVASLGDKGIYTCIATNSAGTVRRSTFLSIFSPPKISSGPNELHAIEGQLLTIKCEVNAEPPPYFTWKKNGQLLNSTTQDIQYLQQNSSIRFVASIHAQGTYTCIATNPAGMTSKDIQVIVMTPPNIYPPYEEQIAAALGENIVLDCQVYGSPPPQVYWQKDGEDLNNDTNGIQIGEDGKLIILNITSESGGIYICDAENDVGISQKLFYFSVNVPPKILESVPPKIQLMEGEDFFLPCTAFGYPLPEIQWHKDGRDIVTLESDDITVLNDGTLMLHSVHQEHSGIYVCVAENKHGSDHRNYIVNVLVPPSMIQAEASTLEVTEGDSLVIACPAMDAVPPPHIEWLKDGKNLDSSSMHFTLLDNGRALKILEAHPSDRGTYWCVASNLAGQSSASFDVDILTAPSFSDSGNIDQPPENQHFEIEQGKPVTFRCVVNGHPSPRVSWKKNNHPITVKTAPGVVLSGDKQILQIPSVHQHDAGHYQCSVSNKVGSFKRDFKLNVMIPPSLTGPNEKSISAISGSNVLLHCPFIGLPEPSISWLKNGWESQILEMNNVIISSDRKVLEITSAKPLDTGIYVCEAHNNAGHGQRMFNISVLDPPSILQGSVVDNVTVPEGDTVILHCWIQGTPYPQIMWMHNGHMLPYHQKKETNRTADIKEELQLRNVQSSDAGQYTCLASNDAGIAEKSFHLHVMVAPKLMHQNDVLKSGTDGIEIPEKHEKIVGMPLTLHCPVEGKPLPEVHWVKDSEPLEPNVIGTGPTLHIDHSKPQHSGHYMCIAHNGAGTASKSFDVVIHEPPIINSSESKIQIKAGDKLILHCQVSGFPTPEVIWFKGAVFISPNTWSQVQLLHNNSTLVVPNMQLKNAGQYSCLAVNKVGTAENVFDVEVLQQPHVPILISTNTTHKVKLNRRLILKCPFEGYPVPNISWYKDGRILHKNFTDSSIHMSSDHRQLHILQAKSQDSGIYVCKAENIAGTKNLSFTVDVQSMAQWTSWSPWSECSSVCGPGEQVRTRTCGEPNLEDPFAQIECPGQAEEWQSCDLAECQVNGAWSAWSSWTSCSVSCGRGTRRRYRQCNNPMPMYGGRICLGSDAQQEYCHQSPCPINGEWGNWSPWTSCSVSCERGVQHRTRLCNNPPPSFGGITCSGKALEVNDCNPQECPKDGQWTSWSKWSTCSTSCGPGNKQRTRECIPPKHGGSECKGENLQISHCTIRSCDNIPIIAELRVKGKLNGEELADSLIAANITDEGSKRIVQASVNDILKHQAGWFPYLTFMLSPVSWNTAMEKDEANNGYSLTQGRFKQESVVEFGSGEGLMLKHIGHGIDNSGVLQVEIEVNGQVPIIEQTAQVVINPFEEDYVQTSPNSLFASSTSTLNVNGVKLPYSWNNTVSYDSQQGTMPYLVEKFSAEEIGVKYNPEKQEMSSLMSTAISKKYNRDTCPDGFVLDPEHMHCRDINECSDKRINRCHVTQICENLFGTYRCSCEHGFRSSAIGKRCVDINECLKMPPPCSHRCRNTRGSFKCQCPPGFILLDDGHTCSEVQYWDYAEETEDVNYVRPIPRTGKGRKKRPNNKLFLKSAAEEHTCPSGFEVQNGVCHDVDECKQLNACSVHETCLNIKGSFRCLETPCPENYERNVESGYCQKFCDEHHCEDGALLSQTITYMVVVPEDEAVHPYQDLVQLSVRGDHGHQIAHTRYRITENEIGKPFRVRFENGQGVLYSMKSLPLGRIHRVEVLALTYDESETNILYTTKFIIFIHLPDD